MDIRQAYLKMLADDVEINLERFDEATGRFLTGGGWAVTNQDLIYPLAVLYTTESPVNPYYRDPRILYHIQRGGDALRDFQNPDGSVEFIKVDGSTWGPIFMCWTMYHWLEAYVLVWDELGPERRARWEEGLNLMFTGGDAIVRQMHVHNIPAWHAMALYRAGQVFENRTWRDNAVALIRQVVAEQTLDGYWYEHLGPTPSYNTVYIHALGLYHRFSGDNSVLDAIRRGTDFQIRYTYPDGRLVETIDGRVKYHDRVSATGLPAYNLSPEGRRYERFLVEEMLKERAATQEVEVEYIQTSLSMKVAQANYGLVPHMASAYAHYHPGPESDIPQNNAEFSIDDPSHALIRRADGWYYCVGAFIAPPASNRWGMDRQMYLSVWTDEDSLIVGGGQSKDQPEWGNFSVPTAEGVISQPTTSRLDHSDAADAVTLGYGDKECTLSTRIEGPTRLVVTMDGPAGTTARLPLRLNPKQPLLTGTGKQLDASGAPLSLDAASTGGWVGQGSWRMKLPAGTSLQWPVLPFNPYAAGGEAPLQQAAALVSVSLTGAAVKFIFEREA